MPELALSELVAPPVIAETYPAVGTPIVSPERLFVHPLAFAIRVLVVSSTLAGAFLLNVTGCLQMGDTEDSTLPALLPAFVPFIIVASIFAVWLFERPRFKLARLRGLGVGILAAALATLNFAVPVSMGALLKGPESGGMPYEYAVGLVNYLVAPCWYFGAGAVSVLYLAIDRMERRFYA